jgi:hypothetical protein
MRLRNTFKGHRIDGADSQASDGNLDNLALTIETKSAGLSGESSGMGSGFSSGGCNHRGKETAPAESDSGADNAFAAFIGFLGFFMPHLSWLLFPTDSRWK